MTPAVHPVRLVLGGLALLTLGAGCQDGFDDPWCDQPRPLHEAEGQQWSFGEAIGRCKRVSIHLEPDIWGDYCAVDTCGGGEARTVTLGGMLSRATWYFDSNGQTVAIFECFDSAEACGDTYVSCVFYGVLPAGCDQPTDWFTGEPTW